MLRSTFENFLEKHITVSTVGLTWPVHVDKCLCVKKRDRKCVCALRGPHVHGEYQETV